MVTFSLSKFGIEKIVFDRDFHWQKTVADPRFPRWGGGNSKGGWHQLFAEKLHENKENWTEWDGGGGGDVSKI